MPDSDSAPDQLSWDQRNTPKSLRFDDIYYNPKDGLAESRYVFVEGNQLPLRWQNMDSGSIFTIVETGFGTGLNFLATWSLWLELASTLPSSCSLHYISIEKYPLSADQLKRAHLAWPELSALSDRLTRVYPPQPWQDLQSLSFSEGSGPSTCLTLIFEDVAKALDHISTPYLLGPVARRQTPRFGEKAARVDAWFLDGFAPSKNPDMWCTGLYQAMAQNSRLDSSFATFTAAGAVKRGLHDFGFNCRKQSGFGHKREMLLGSYSGRPNIASKSSSQGEAKSSSRISARSATDSPTWPFKTQEQAQVNAAKEVLVIGGGLAGCQCANALARIGFKVSLLESKGLASGASANIQGAVYTKLSLSEGPLSEFNRVAQLYADCFYQETDLYTKTGAQCGVLHLAIDKKEEQRLSAFAKSFLSQSQFRFCSPVEASKLAGAELDSPALFAEKSGWLSPVKLCYLLIQHPNIKVVEHFNVQSLESDQDKWVVSDGQASYSAPFCVVANAALARNFTQLQTLPMQYIRGQVNHLESLGDLQKLKTVLCGEGYLTPATEFAKNQIHSLGATFNLKNTNASLSDEDTDTNLQSLARISRSFDELGYKHLYKNLPGKVGFRSTTPDYMPMIGPVPNISAINQSFARLRKKANADIDSCGDYYPGLYCMLGFGSRGLAYTPICSTIIARLIGGGYLPISLSLYKHLHPARFAIRALMRNKDLP